MELRPYLFVGAVFLLMLGAYWLTVPSDDPANQTAPVTPAPNVRITQPTSTVPTIASRLKDHLLIMGADGYPHGFDNAKLDGIKYFAFYYSACWCPPCRAFTPDLVMFYKDFKPSHPDFELIFVNEDASDSDMIGYMKIDSMPWPAVWFQDVNNPQVQAKKYAGPAIPCLVLVNAEGQVLSDSFRHGGYVGPQVVMNDISTMVH